MIKLVSQALNKRQNGEKGFTLIELLVVVIIIGILAAVAIPVFLNMRTGAWKSSVESDVKNAVLVVEQATTKANGSLPTSAAGTFDNSTDTVYDPTAATSKIEGVSVVVSKGNKLVIAKGAKDNTYTITGTNKDVAGDSYVYDSSKGAGAWTGK